MTTSIKFRALNDEDYRLFFEALGEHGKDFQNIQQYIAQKGGLKSSNNKSSDSKPSDLQDRRDFDKKEEDRKREQIRNFYNKLYAKLSQLIGKLDDRVERVNQELYLLINYGEIWKKHGFKFNTKTKKLLEELVLQGSTTFRFEKKNVRLRTPPCKALKKINEIGIDEKVKVVTSREIPKEVLVEFHPSTNRDWLKVQAMSQNPRLRARLSIQKRVSTILEYLEAKWNISQSKLDRTVDSWLKISSGTDTKNLEKQPSHRLRLKPSSYHELKDVNITRVVPDNHLDLSLNAYTKRLANSNSCEPPIKCEAIQAEKRMSQLDDTSAVQNFEFSSSGAAVNSKLPVSLTTPDCSIMFERSCTSDQPSIAQARRHLQLLTALEGCENSRTAYEDTQDRSLMNMIMNNNSRSIGFNSQRNNNNANDRDYNQSQQVPTIMVNNNIPALYDEDAALPVSSSTQNVITSQPISNLPNNEGQDGKPLDFQIPKNVTLGDFFNMTGGQADGTTDDVANDAFPTKVDQSCDEEAEPRDIDKECEEQYHEAPTKDNISPGNNQAKLQNHMIEISKFTEGWTLQDDSSTTLGELYLAFKCPDKIIFEYEFEQYSCDDNQQHIIQENPSDSILIFKLLTAASLTLSHIERHKQEQQLKLHEHHHQCPRLKKRKGSVQTMTSNMPQDIETRNQLVDEILKSDLSTRIMFRRTRRPG